MDYYIDSRGGENGNAGTSPEEAWQDFTPINDRSLMPGDRLLLKRGSHWKGQLRLRAVGTAERWIEVTAYGEGPRPVVEGRSVGGAAEIHQSGTLDESTPCIHILEAGFLRVSHITVYHAIYGLLINNENESRSHIEVEDVIAYDIQNFGQDDPRVNSAGIEIVLGRGRECRDLTVSEVAVRRCECVRTGCGFSFRAYGPDCRMERVRAEKFTDHDHANTPWSYVGLFLNRVYHSTFDGVCLDGCAPHWKNTGTAMVHYIHSDHVVVKNSYFANTQDTDSHDMGAWDFEGGGDDCTIEHCTFRDNAGPAIEYLRTQPTIQNAVIRGCTFINNDWTLWGGAAVLHDGRSGPAPTGEIVDNCFVLAPGTRIGDHQAIMTMRDNWTYDREEDLPPFLAPPTVDAGPDRALIGRETVLRGRVENAQTFRWEVLIAPGAVTLDDPERLCTRAQFAAPGTYVLRLVAENEHFLYGGYVTIRCLEEAHQELLAHWPFRDSGADASGRGHEARLVGGARYGPGPQAGMGALVLDNGKSGAEANAPAFGATFTIAAWVKVDCAAMGAQTILANAAGPNQSDGFKLHVNHRDTQDGAILFETGNGTDSDFAYTDAGVFTFDTWHHLAVSVDATSQDGRGTARIVLDGRDVTCFGGVQSDFARRARLFIGRLPARAAQPAPAPVGDVVPGDPVPPGFALAFREDFRGAWGDRWEILGGEWRVADGVLHVKGKGELRCQQRFPGDVILVYDACSDDPGDLSATLNALPENGPMFGYFFGFGTNGNAGSKFLRRTGPVAAYDVRIVPGRMHRVACARQGKVLTHIVDGKTVFVHEDPRPISSGRQPYVALYVHTTARIQGVRIYTRTYQDEASDRPLRGAISDLCLYDRALAPAEVAWILEEAGHGQG